MKYLPIKKAALAVAMSVWLLGPIAANAEIIDYDINFSTVGSGTLDYNDVTLAVDLMTLDFGEHGSMEASFGPTLTASVFGAPPNPTTSSAAGNQFFLNDGGPNISRLFLRSDGTFCLTPIALFCEEGDVILASGTYNIALSITTVNVSIDIKPGSFPNSINLGSGGATPVAILGSATLNVNDIDITTLTLGTAGIKTVGKTDRNLCSVNDVSGDFTAGPEGAPDDFDDLVCHFITVDIVTEAGDTEATISGNLLAGAGGTAIEGTDSVNIVPK